MMWLWCVCKGLNVIAYASYCQRDQRGKPIAGYINICPQMLTDDSYDEEKIYWVTADFVCWVIVDYVIMWLPIEVLTPSVSSVSLPLDIQSSPSLTVFHQRLKTFLFRKSFPHIVL